MAQIFPIDFDEKLTIANWDFILFSDSEDGNKIKKAQYSNLKWEQGDPGTPGADGAAATITVWSTTTGTPWSSASVVNSWTSSAAVLDFTIPQWAKWEPWEDGDDWAAATITVWTTTTLPAWSSATVTNVWTSQDAILNFWIPKWDSWSGSWDVSWPASSTDWDVAIFDWATGKLIKDGSVALSTLSSAASLASTAVQPWDNVSDLVNDAWYITSAPVSSVNSQTWAVVLDADDISDTTTTNKFVTASDKSTWSGKQDALWKLTITLTSAWWSSKTQTVSATGVTASNTVIVSPDASDYSDYTDAEIYCSAQGSGTLTFTCGTEPTNDIDVNVVII